MTAIGQALSSSCDDDERLRNVIRLDKLADTAAVSDQHRQHVVRRGPFHGVIIRQPTNGESKQSETSLL